MRAKAQAVVLPPPSGPMMNRVSTVETMKACATGPGGV
ncbi:hypothetical protein ABIE76_004133 [Sinorhizobium fredii]